MGPLCIPNQVSFSRLAAWLNVDLDGIDKRQAITRARSKRVSCRHSATGPPPFCTRVSDRPTNPLSPFSLFQRLIWIFSEAVVFDTGFIQIGSILLVEFCMFKQNFLWPYTFLATELFSGGSIHHLIYQLSYLTYTNQLVSNRSCCFYLIKPIKGFGIPPERPKPRPPFSCSGWWWRMCSVYSVAVSLIRLGKTETTKNSTLIIWWAAYGLRCIRRNLLTCWVCRVKGTRTKGLVDHLVFS